MSAEQTPTLAGKYILLKKLAAGGMAEVHLARQVGLEGFEKLVVLKRIQPQFAEDPEFVTMFLDEARTAADLRHPNVVDIYEVGEHEGNYFIAMEYIHGQSLRRIQRDLAAKGIRMPLPLAAHVVIESARGLDYAHRKVDLQGRPLGIVHRDVSPQNILVSFQGETKIVDFGIARAASRSRQTAPGGGLFGKLDYMSPEQALGAPIGPRSDLFSLAIVLFELTTGRRLFWHESDAMTIRQVIACQVPRPSTIVEGYPEALEAIVLSALAVSPEDRPAGCKELADALEDWLARTSQPHSDTRLGEFVRDLYPDDSRELPPPPMPVARPIAAAPATARPSGEGSVSFSGGADTPTGYDPMNPPPTRQTPLGTLDEGRAGMGTVPRPVEDWIPDPPRAKTPAPAPPPPGSPWKPFLMGVAATLIAGVIGWAVLDQFKDKRVYVQAGVLMGKGENVTALEVLHTRLKDDPADPLLREMAVRAGSAEIDRRAATDPRDALGWLEGQLEERPYLEPLRKRIPVLSVMALLEDRRGSSRERFERVWDLLRRYPEDAEAPFVAAEIIGRTHIPDASLPFFEEALHRGHAALPAIWDDCREALESNVPSEHVVGRVYEICGPYYANEIDAWIALSLTSGGTYAWVNAAARLEQRRDPRVTEDPVLLALVRFSTARSREGDLETILAEKDAARGARIRDAFRELARTHSVPAEVKEAIREVLPRVEARWPDGQGPEAEDP